MIRSLRRRGCGPGGGGGGGSAGADDLDPSLPACPCDLELDYCELSELMTTNSK